MKDSPELTAARAAADRQLALAGGGLDELVATARALLATHGRTDTWARMAVRVAARLNCTGRYQQFGVEMLVAAVLRLAEQPDPDPGLPPVG